MQAMANLRCWLHSRCLGIQVERRLYVLLGEVGH